MLASITPLGERARRMNWGITTAYYVAGSTAGGAAIGALAGALGSLVLDGVAFRARLAALAAALAAGLAYEVARGAVPGPRRQVNEQWLDRYRGWVYGLGFGAQLGAGVTTVVVSSAVYGVLAAAFLSGRVDAGLAIGAGAGALRGATVLAGAKAVTPQRLIAFHERMRTLQRPVRGAALAAQLVLAGLALLAAVAGGPARRPRRREVKLAAHGIELDLPRGWDGRIYRRPGGDPTLHAASFPLPASDGDFGSGATGRMPSGGAFLALKEYRPGPRLVPGRGLFAPSPPALPLDPRRFHPRTLQVGRPEQAGLQHFFTAAGRPFCLYAVIRTPPEPLRAAPAHHQVGALSRILASLTIHPRP